MTELLENLNACYEAKNWAEGKSWKKVFETCHRGDWLLWLFKKTMIDDEINLRRLTLAKAHCANTVRKLMKDQRSINAVDMAIKFGNNEATREELNSAAYGAAYGAASYVYGVYVVYGSYVYDAYGAASYVYDAYGAAAKIKNQLETADICRKYLPIEIWNINL